ncbi:MAG: hypothetical protein NTZ49_02560 [Candidatus Parcubacteria bacterium]|nr:hypothetical protein [Candidatus Parcubacteria bacterium]
MIETTKDILFLVLAFVVLLLTIFLCWALYYLTMILREFKKITFDVRRKIVLVETVINALKERIEHTSSYMKLLVESAGNIVEFLKDRKDEKDKKKKK